ncbi:MAG: MFS transporter, partial [Deltaproteobacteria bacterium]
MSYILSQFFRSFLAVLAPSLELDIGAAADDLSRASAAFFLTFAAAQIPVGWSLDHVGPRRTATLPFAIFGGGGALFVAFAQTPLAVEIGMGLIGLGVAPILMATYFILLRTYPTAAFATMAGMFVGFGSLGNLFGSIPLAEAVETIGWRTAMQIVAGLTLLGAIAIWIFVRDPERVEGQSAKGGFIELLRIRALWPIIIMIAVSYAPSISMRGVWMGPYLKDTFALTTREIGWSTMAMALAMIAALVALGHIDRWFNRKKTLIISCGILNVILFVALPFVPTLGPAIIMFILIGWFGSIYP